MNQPWIPEREVSAEFAAKLVTEQFPDLANASIERIGAGWDNVAFLFNDQWLFRFPARQIAVECLQNELFLLPKIAHQVTSSIPVPSYIGQATEEYDWPFYAYKILPGVEAAQTQLPAELLPALAIDLACFLKSLHQIETQSLKDQGAPSDRHNRTDVSKMIKLANTRINKLTELGLIENGIEILELVNNTPLYQPCGESVVHGDLHIRHILLTDGKISGVIDWGDCHIGDPSIDLLIAFSLFDATNRALFFQEYGPVSDASLSIARLRSIGTSAALAVYAQDISDQKLLEGALKALQCSIR